MSDSVMFDPKIHCVRTDVARDLREQACLATNGARMHLDQRAAMAAAEAMIAAENFNALATTYESGTEITGK